MSGLIRVTSWIQKAAGAVWRTIADVLSDSINVRNFGAKLDGVTDDTAAIQRAINHAGVGNPFDGTMPTVVVKFVPGRKCLILGTLYIPSFVVLDLCGCLLVGGGDNTMFATGYWSNGQVVPNAGQADETQFVVCSGVVNGSISNCDRAFNLLNFCESSKLDNLRLVGVNQAWYARHCFYGTFKNVHARSPLVGDKYPCYHFDGEVNAIGLDSVFAVAYNTPWRFSGNKDNIHAVNCGAEQGSVGIDVHGITSAMSLKGWYFEDLITAVYFDPDGNHENVSIDGCWFQSVTNAVGGTNVSGEWGNNRLDTSVLDLPDNFTNRLRVRIATDSTPDNAVFQLPAQYTLGDTCEVDYVKAVYDSQSGAVAVKARVHAGVIPAMYSGDVGVPVANQIPGCDSVLTANSLTVDSKIRYRSDAWVGVRLTIQASGIQNIYAIVLDGTQMIVQKSAVVFTVSNNNGYYRFAVTGLNAATGFGGTVKLLAAA